MTLRGFLPRFDALTGDGKREAALLWEKVTGQDFSSVFSLLRTGGDLEPTEAQAAQFDALLTRREAGEPIQYLCGSADFYGYRFFVSEGVLIPRFDTEILVEAALKEIGREDTVYDFCAGTGCIGLTVAKESGAKVTLAEKYQPAFRILEKNRAALCPTAVAVQADVLTASFPPADFILSNPPYIATPDLAGLSPEVRHEPVTALDGGEDGLAFYRLLIPRCFPALKRGGVLFLEIGKGQHDSVAALLRAAGFSSVSFLSDYQKILRVVRAEKD